MGRVVDILDAEECHYLLTKNRTNDRISATTFILSEDNLLPADPSWRTRGYSDTYRAGNIYGYAPNDTLGAIVDFAGEEGIRSFEEFIKVQFNNSKIRNHQYKTYNIYKWSEDPRKRGGQVFFKLSEIKGAKIAVNQKDNYPGLKFITKENGGFAIMPGQKVGGVEYYKNSFKALYGLQKVGGLTLSESLNTNIKEQQRRQRCAVSPVLKKEVLERDYKWYLSNLALTDTIALRVAYALQDTPLSLDVAEKLYYDWYYSFKSRAESGYAEKLWTAIYNRGEFNAEAKKCNMGIRAIIAWALEARRKLNYDLGGIKEYYNSLGMDEEDLKVGEFYARFFYPTTSKATLVYDPFSGPYGQHIPNKNACEYLEEIEDKLLDIYNLASFNSFKSNKSLFYFKSYDEKFNCLNKHDSFYKINNDGALLIRKSK